MDTTDKLRMRRTYIVDRRFQWNLVFRAVGFQVFTILALGFGLFLPLLGDDRAELANAEAYDRTVSFLYMHERFWPVALVCVLFAILAVVRVSHRIAGPLVRVKRTMRFVGEGHFPAALRTRDHDFLKDEVDVLNEMVAKLADRVDRLKRAQAELSDSLTTCAWHARRGDLDETAASLGEALAHARELEDGLGGFTREGDPEAVPAEAPAEQVALVP